MAKRISKREDLSLDPRNANKGTERGRYMLEQSLRECGAGRSILTDKEGRVIAGNKTLEVAEELDIPIRVVETDGRELVVVQRSDLDLDSEQARKLAYYDNRSSEVGLAWDAEQIAADLEAGLDLGAMFGEDELAAILRRGNDELLAGADNVDSQEAHQTLAERFGVPPFSVLDARQGYWQRRKRAWLSLGIQSELGRNGNPRLTWVAGSRPIEKLDEVSRKNLAAQPQSGSSIFDPVLCELIYRWFSPPGGEVLDPFAGGSVRGIVAAILGRHYTGIDLRAEQIGANEEQAQTIIPESPPRWLVADALDIATVAPGEYDLIFTCPPYVDLEVYSDDPRDLSTMNYADFLATYRKIIAASLGMLRPNRFAAICVGDVRDKGGFYRNFVSDTIAAFQGVGVRLYNEAILVTEAGSAPLRVGKQFVASRKLGKTHQNVLIFVKGDPRKATQAVGEVEFSAPEEMSGD